MRLYNKAKYLRNKCPSITSLLHEYHIFFIYFKNYKAKYSSIIYIYNSSTLCFMIGTHVVSIQRNIPQIPTTRRFVQIIQRLINLTLNVSGIFVMPRVPSSEGRRFGSSGSTSNRCRSLVKNRQSSIFAKGSPGHILRPI